jgi:TRAP-type C4-dicarboxylate transport system permease large subunit
VILGTAMEELSMILLTVPVFFSARRAPRLRPVWFGIIIVVVVQIGLISPPVGMNMFVGEEHAAGRRDQHRSSGCARRFVIATIRPARDPWYAFSGRRA